MLKVQKQRGMRVAGCAHALVLANKKSGEPSTVKVLASQLMGVLCRFMCVFAIT